MFHLEFCFPQTCSLFAYCWFSADAFSPAMMDCLDSSLTLPSKLSSVYHCHSEKGSNCQTYIGFLNNYSKSMLAKYLINLQIKELKLSLKCPGHKKGSK